MPKNKYSYAEGDDLKGRIPKHDASMRKYNLNIDAIREFAKALKEGNIEAIQTEFNILEDNQKQGLLDIEIHYNELWQTPMNLGAPSGRSIDLANKFNWPDIAAFLIEQKNILDRKHEAYAAYTEGAIEGILSSQLKPAIPIPADLSKHIGLFLKRADGISLALTSQIAAKTASKRRSEEEAKIKSPKKS